MLIIDGDGHLVEPLNVWSDYVSTASAKRIYLTRDDHNNADKLVLGDFAINLATPPVGDNRGPLFGWGDSTSPGGLSPGQARGRHYGDSEPGGWDMARRLEMHDTEGIGAGVLFGTLALHFGAITDADVAVAACQAVNNWAADAVSVAPGELYVVATLPEHFPELAAIELRRCVEDLGFVSGALRPNPLTDGRCLNHPDYDHLWKAAVDLGVPLCIHNIGSKDRPQLGEGRPLNFSMNHAAVHPLEAMVAFALLCQANVFERFGALHVGFMESGCGWAPFWIERLFEHHEVLGWMADPLNKRDPAEIFSAQCVIGCEGEESMVPYVQDRFGDRSVMWASDFPHYDVVPPYTKDMLERDDLSASQREGVLQGSAVQFYGLDLERIERANSKRTSPTTSRAGH